MGYGDPVTDVCDRRGLVRFAWMSIVAALATMGLKLVAWRITGSVGILSDALESTVNLAAAVMALGVLIFAARPPDEDHEFGHEKAEFFACGAEGALILLAAAGIAIPAWERLRNPMPVEEPGLGLTIAVIASLLNFAVARAMLNAGRRARSITLEADAHHLMTDVWTSAGVLVAVGLVDVTGWLILDPLIALVVALNIVWTGVGLLKRSASGLLDPALPPEEREIIEKALRSALPHEAAYHALLTRQAGPRRYASVHILVPGHWTVDAGHHLLEEVEEEIRRALPDTVVFTHLEPLEDPRSYKDQELFREVGRA